MCRCLCVMVGGDDGDGSRPRGQLAQQRRPLVGDGRVLEVGVDEARDSGTERFVAGCPIRPATNGFVQKLFVAGPGRAPFFPGGSDHVPEEVGMVQPGRPQAGFLQLGRQVGLPAEEDGSQAQRARKVEHNQRFARGPGRVIGHGRTCCPFSPAAGQRPTSDKNGVPARGPGPGGRRRLPSEPR